MLLSSLYTKGREAEASGAGTPPIFTVAYRNVIYVHTQLYHDNLYHLHIVVR